MLVMLARAEAIARLADSVVEHVAIHANHPRLSLFEELEERSALTRLRLVSQLCGLEPRNLPYPG